MGFNAAYVSSGYGRPTPDEPCTAQAGVEVTRCYDDPLLRRSLPTCITSGHCRRKCQSEKRTWPNEVLRPHVPRRSDPRRHCFNIQGALTDGADIDKEVSKMTDYVLIHGAWHGSWCWTRVRHLLAAGAHRVFTPTLTGAENAPIS
jgi:hypothetical protein